METPLSALLRKFMEREEIGTRVLASKSGVLEKTIEKWRAGEVRKPRYWQDIAKVALVLRLSLDECNQLLASAGHSDVASLKVPATGEDRKLLEQLASTPVMKAPFQVIHDLPYFVGREKELAQIRETLLNGHHVTVVSVAGMGGVGKTALAVHLAYDLRSYFTDGVLWARVDMTDPILILGAFASALGQNVEHLRDLETRSAAVRSLLATRRVLLILDNATTSAQVRPLLPPSTGSSAALITTRHDLAIGDELRRFEIAPFDPELGESLLLFTKLLGKEFVQRYLAIFSKIADCVGHLPLAVNIAAARMRPPSEHSVTTFWRELQSAGQQLNILQREDRSVRISFDLSYSHLPPALQQFFDNLGAFAGEDFDIEAVAYITQYSHEKTTALVEDLKQRSLVQPSQLDRYRLHPLIRLYALEHLSLDPRSASQDPHDRMVEYYVLYAERNANNFTALRDELSNLIVAQQQSAKRGLADMLLRLTNALFPFLEVQGLYDVANSQMADVYLAAEQSGDLSAIATVMMYQGIILMRIGDYYKAQEKYEQALRMAQQQDHTELVCRLYRYISAIAFSVADYGKSLEYVNASLQVAQDLDNIDLIGQAFVSRGVTFAHMNNYQAAELDYADALKCAEQMGRPVWLLTLLVNQGENLVHQTKLQEARECWNSALSYARELNHQERASNLLGNLAGLFLKLGDLQKAAEFALEGLTIARQIGHRWLMSLNFRELGYVKLAKMEFAEAMSCFSEALNLANEINAQHLIGEALYGLGKIAETRNDFVSACEYGEKSAEVFASIGYFRASEVQVWLKNLHQNQ